MFKRGIMKNLLALLMFSVVVSGCTVSLSVNSSGPGARTLANPAPADNGWIEIAVLDETIGCAGSKSGQGPGLPCQPPVCSLEVKLDKKQYAHEQMSAFGDKPPFKVDTGFRFAAPAGELALEMIFICLSPGQPVRDLNASVVAEMPIEVRKGMVTELMFDGQKIIFLGHRQDQTPILKDFKEKSNVSNDNIRQRSF